MKKIIFLLITSLSIVSCADFLDENPNKTGNNYIYDIEQIDQMINYANTYLKGGYSPGARIGFINAIASDDLNYHPEIISKIGAVDMGLIAINDRDYMTYAFSNTYEFSDANRVIFHMNTALANVDKVTGSQERKDQYRAEALAYRAYFQFLNLLTYCHHPAYKGDSPGLGYMDNVNLTPESNRGTVDYTMSRIYQDINDAMAIFNEQGSPEFNVNINWRINKTNLMAFKARVDLYNGKYKDAYEAASFALSKYSALNDYNEDVETSDPYYMVTYTRSFDLADGSQRDITEQWPHFTKLSDARVNDIEMFIPGFISNPFGGSLPMSESLNNTYTHKATDLRYQKFWQNNGFLISAGVPNFTGIELDAIEDFKLHTFRGVTSETSYSSIKSGPSVAEMMLIKAECIARGEASGNETAQSILQALRRTRFSSTTDANNIGGTLQDVMHERRREMPLSIRWYDVKRYNALDNAGINVTKYYFSDPADANSSVKTYTFDANSNFFVFPIPFLEIDLLPGWEQNEPF